MLARKGRDESMRLNGGSSGLPPWRLLWNPPAGAQPVSGVRGFQRGSRSLFGLAGPGNCTLTTRGRGFIYNFGNN